MPSYTPKHRRAVLKGLRILARVAIRSYMEEKAARGWADGVWGKEAETGAGLGSLRWRSFTTGGRAAGAASS